MILHWLERVMSWRLRRMGPQDRAHFVSRLLKRLALQGSTEEALEFCFTLDNRLYRLESEISTSHEKGIHPKHRITRYHDFFVSNLEPGESVLDIGSGRGYLAHQMASRVRGVHVLGMESNPKYIDYARQHYRHPHLTFVLGDALTDLPHDHFQVVTLSNVLEHLPERSRFLKSVIAQVRPRKLLIRVPQYDRDWRVALKDEIGVDSRLNQGHTIEYTKDRLLSELTEAELSVSRLEFSWGEIWAVAEPEKIPEGASNDA